MGKNMKIITKSDYLGGLIKEAIAYDKLTDKQAKSYNVGKPIQQVGESLIGIFLMDMLNAGYRVDIEMDMTYGSISQLPLVTSSCLQGHCTEGYDLMIAADATARCLAAYLFALGINEHDTRLKVEQKRTALSKPDPDEGPLWANTMRITTGTIREKDFLIPVMEGGSGHYILRIQRIHEHLLLS